MATDIKTADNEVEKDRVEDMTPATPRDGKSMTTVMLKWMRANLLLVLTMGAVIVGIVFGGALRSAGLSKSAITIIGLPGDVLVRLLKLLVLPLVISSLITGLTNLDSKTCGKLGVRAVVYYITTTCIAVILGIIVVVTISPGRRAQGQHEKDFTKYYAPLESFVDILRNLFPSNLVQAAFQQATTVYSLKKDYNDSAEVNCSMANATKYGECLDSAKGFKDGMNVLGLLVYTIPFGILLGRMGERSRVMVEFFDVLCDITMQLVNMVMWYSPIGVMSLICAKFLGMGKVDEIISMLSLYIVAVLLGLLIHVGILMTIFFAVTKQNPLVFFKGIFQAWLTAFATASSGATLPVTFRCLEENLNIDKRVTRFVLPIGATVNMDGTALYEAVAAIFIAQMHGRSGFSTIVIISLTATLGSIGAASIPSAGIVTLVLVLTATGLPLTDVGLLMAVDWFLDRCRTSVNVVGDSYGAGIVYHLSKKDLEASDKEEAETEMGRGTSAIPLNGEKPEKESGNSTSEETLPKTDDTKCDSIV